MSFHEGYSDKNEPAKIDDAEDCLSYHKNLLPPRKSFGKL